MRVKKFFAALSISILVITYWIISNTVNTALMSALSSVCFCISLALAIYTYKELPIKSLIFTSLIYALASSNEVFEFFLNHNTIGYTKISKPLWDLGNFIRIFIGIEIIIIMKNYKLIRRK